MLLKVVNPSPQLNLGNNALNNIVVQSVHPQIEEYQKNMSMIQYFKKQAEESKRKVRFPQIKNQEEGNKYYTIKT